MNYIQLKDIRDADIPDLNSLYRMPEISRFIHIDGDRYWNYVTGSENVFYYKVYQDELLVAAIHCELSDHVLFMDIAVFPEHQRHGIASRILRDIQDELVLDGFRRIEVSIEESNAASRRLFEKMGYVPASKEDALILYTYQK